MVEKAAKYTATGRRKTSTARVTLTPGTGKWVVNQRTPEAYFKTEAVLKFLEQPMTLTNTRDKFDLTANITGGGIVGQAGALRHAISRALCAADLAMRPTLKEHGCLTRDARMKERKKYGQPGARKRFQFSKR